MFENDKTNYNLISSSKQLISKLLTKNELTNHLIKITVKLSFYYDKPFYFVTIDDEKKLYINISKSLTSKIIIKYLKTYYLIKLKIIFFIINQLKNLKIQVK